MLYLNDSPTSASKDTKVSQCNESPTKKNEWPRLLVMTGSVPGANGVGAILVKQILQQIPRELLRIATFTQKVQHSVPAESNAWVDANFIRRYEPAYRPVKGILGDVISYVAHLTVGQPYLRKLAQQCVSEGKLHGCNGVLAVMDNPTVIRIAEKVARKLGVPLYSFVMDDPALQANDFGFGRLLRASLQRSFDRAMKHSHRIAVAGESMRDAYEKLYKKRGSILRQGLPYTPDDSSPSAVSESNKIVIGFAGSMTARDTYEQLITELDRRNWKLAGKKVIFRIIGSYLKLVPSAPQHIEYFGWRSVPELVALSKECDFLYLPQSFSEDLRAFTELSFPNKLCTYLPARRPIILHTPSYGSLGRFFSEYPCGPVTHEFEPTSLLDEVEHIVMDKKEYRNFQGAIESALENALNEDFLKSEVRSFLGENG